MAKTVSDSLMWLSTMAQMSEMVTQLEYQNQNSRLRELEIEQSGEIRKQELGIQKERIEFEQQHDILTFNQNLYNTWSPNVIIDDPNRKGYKTLKDDVKYEDSLAYTKLSADAIVSNNQQMTSQYPWLIKQGETLGDEAVTKRIADFSFYQTKGQQYSNTTGTILQDKYYRSGAKNLFTGIDESAGWLSESDIVEMKGFVSDNVGASALDSDIESFLKGQGFLRDNETYDYSGTGGQDTVSREVILDRVEAFSTGLRSNKESFFSSQVLYDQKQLEMLQAQTDISNALVDNPSLKLAMNEFTARSEDLKTIIPQVVEGDANIMFNNKEYDLLDDGDIKKLKQKAGGTEYYTFIKSVMNGTLSTIETYGNDPKALESLKNVLAREGQTGVYNNLISAINDYSTIHGAAGAATSIITGLNNEPQKVMEDRQTLVDLTNTEFVSGGIKKTLGEWLLDGKNPGSAMFFSKISKLGIPKKMIDDFLTIYTANR